MSRRPLEQRNIRSLTKASGVHYVSKSKNVNKVDGKLIPSTYL